MAGPRPLQVTISGGGAGTPVVMVHGFLGSGDDWSELTGALAGTRRCLRVELPGHGSAAATSGVTFDGAVASLQRVIESQPGAVDLIGYSMGGRIALGAALANPGRIRRLVIISATPGLESGGEQAARARADDALAEQMEQGGLARFLTTWYDQPLFASLRTRAALRRELQQRRGRGNAAALAAALRGLTVGRQPSLWPRLAALPMPVLMVAGQLDGKYAALLGRAAGLCPRGRLLMVPGAGHMPHLEHPDFLTAQVRAFLDD
mgnify:CR=1 FL=1